MGRVLDVVQCNIKRYKSKRGRLYTQTYTPTQIHRQKKKYKEILPPQKNLHSIMRLLSRPSPRPWVTRVSQIGGECGYVTDPFALVTPKSYHTTSSTRPINISINIRTQHPKKTTHQALQKKKGRLHTQGMWKREKQNHIQGGPKLNTLYNI